MFLFSAVHTTRHGVDICPMFVQNEEKGEGKGGRKRKRRKEEREIKGERKRKWEGKKDTKRGKSKRREPRKSREGREKLGKWGEKTSSAALEMELGFLWALPVSLALCFFLTFYHHQHTQSLTLQQNWLEQNLFIYERSCFLAQGLASLLSQGIVPSTMSRSIFGEWAQAS